MILHMDWIWNAASVAIALGALVLSILAFRRSSTPQPSWRFISVTRHFFNEMHTDGPSSAWYTHETFNWAATVRQDGPGVAESIWTQVRPAGGEWTAPLRLDLQEIGRGGEVVINLGAEDATGPIELRIIYRCLPNTRIERRWEHSVELVDATP